MRRLKAFIELCNSTGVLPQDMVTLEAHTWHGHAQVSIPFLELETYVKQLETLEPQE